MTPGEFVIVVICIVESSFLAWGWLCGGFRRVNIPPCSERLAYLERELSTLKEQLHADRNTLNRTALWVDHRRRQEKEAQGSAAPADPMPPPTPPAPPPPGTG